MAGKTKISLRHASATALALALAACGQQNRQASVDDSMNAQALAHCRRCRRSSRWPKARRHRSVMRRAQPRCRRHGRLAMPKRPMMIVMPGSTGPTGSADTIIAQGASAWPSGRAAGSAVARGATDRCRRAFGQRLDLRQRRQCGERAFMESSTLAWRFCCPQAAARGRSATAQRDFVFPAMAGLFLWLLKLRGGLARLNNRRPSVHRRSLVPRSALRPRRDRAGQRPPIQSSVAVARAPSPAGVVM